jgi:hypothetical protein
MISRPGGDTAKEAATTPSRRAATQAGGTTTKERAPKVQRIVNSIERFIVL